MGPGFFILAVMGCGDAATVCDDLRVERQLYHSETACYEQSDAALDRSLDAPYPMLVAECREITPQAAQAVRSNDEI